jgi:holliday junction DNA helicase RuvA
LSCGHARYAAGSFFSEENIVIANLRGKVIYKDLESIVVECGGVGYGVLMSVSGIAKIVEGSDVSLFIYTQIGEGILRLFGFLELDERRLFETLLGTSGVGPKLALAIMSSVTPDELAAIVTEQDQPALIRIPGIGKKTAERLLLELKDRLPKKRSSGAHTIRHDLTSALLHLGFTPNVAQDATQHAMETMPNIVDIAVLMREALRATR